MTRLGWTRWLVLAAALGCASTPPAPTPAEKTVPSAQSLLGSSWELVDLGGAPVLADHRPTLEFSAPGHISGSASCNHYSATVELGDGTLRVGPQMATTRMACPPPIDAQEQAFLVALQNARRMELGKGELVVQTESLEQPLRFRRLN